MFKKKVFTLSLAAAFALASQSALAATATTTIPVTASVSAGCTISVGATPLAFGAYDPIGANATAPLTTVGSVIVTCAKNSAGTLTIGMGPGLNFLTTRQLKSGTDTLAYDVGQPSTNAAGATCTFPATTAWNTTGAGVLTLTSPPSKAPRSYNICGSIPGGQDAAAGATYTDTITATINF